MKKAFFYPGFLLRMASAALVVICILCSNPAFSQKKATSKSKAAKSSSKRVIYGLASFYHDRFNGRKTASGEIFSQSKFTAACNMVPFGTWIRVTNVHNGKSVVVKVNDRLHTRMRRIVDLSGAASRKIVKKKTGLVRVKVEVLGKKKPK